MAENKNIEPKLGAVQGKENAKKKNPLEALKLIKLKNPLSVSDKDKPVDSSIYLVVKSVGFTIGHTTVRYSKLDLQENTIMMLKKEPRLAAWTTATAEQMELIKNTKSSKLENL